MNEIWQSGSYEHWVDPGDDDDGIEVATPLGETGTGHLRFTNSIARYVTIQGIPLGDEFFRARFEHPVPGMHITEDTVEIQYHSFFRSFPFRGERPGTILLNTAIPWSIESNGGAAWVTMNLEELQLLSLAHNGGLSNVVVMLPKPVGIVPVHLAGGVSQVTLFRPAGTQARVSVKGGAYRLTLDASHFGAIGSQTRWESSGFNDEGNGYDIRIQGGASKVVIAAH
ncbi:MAG TPA: hypothetical protein VHI13_01820 [Candidatus Kapabacteria bacterium]|nr:hypothetical protein [Candidatus Kapabacteria bacterium]